MPPGSTSRGHLPDPLAKREVLYSEGRPADELAAMGRTFQEEGYLLDALDFFVESGATQDLERLLEQALEEGDLFIFECCASALGRKPAPEDWLALAARADQRGKAAFAARAREKAGGSDAPDGGAKG